MRCRPGRTSPHPPDTCYQSAMTDPYAILGVSRSASSDEIRSAYRKLAKSLHPDTRPDDEAAEERFKQVTSAFKLLSDPDKRAQFDRGEIDAEGRERPAFHYRTRREAGPFERGPSGRFEDLGDLFSDLFASAPRGGARAGSPAARDGADVKTRIEVSLDEAVSGVKRRVAVAGRKLDVTIPAGVEDGRVLRLRGQGHPGANGGRPGALLVEVAVKPHPWFKREGHDVRLDLPISIREAVFGAKVRAPTLDGPVELRVPAGSSSGAVLRLRGRGLPDSDGQRGDQLVRLMVDVPTNDTDLEGFLEDWTPPTGYDPRARFRS